VASADGLGAEGRVGAAPSLTIFAAASMTTALNEIAASWTAKTGQRPSIVYASSAVHARQIKQGAPADIFISADESWADFLEKAKLLRPGTRHNFVGNDLVLIAPADSKATLKIEPGFDLAGAIGSGRLAVCTVASCPGGMYVREALTHLGVWEKVEPRLAQASNIRGALNLVARGEAPFGIVYATDANADRSVRVIGTFPADSHSPIVYPVAILASSKHSEAQSFVAYLSSPTAGKILREQGFTILSEEPPTRPAAGTGAPGVKAKAPASN
jgi:molybdate transport system substrate-binding protein